MKQVSFVGAVAVIERGQVRHIFPVQGILPPELREARFHGQKVTVLRIVEELLKDIRNSQGFKEVKITPDSNVIFSRFKMSGRRRMVRERAYMASELKSLKDVMVRLS